jgi:DNA-binding transcriptional regulator/RsmH inhibitor MraZ
VPSEWREAPFEQSLTIMPTEDKYLRVYPASWLGRKQAALDANPNSTEMQYEQLADLASSSNSASLDAQGRIIIKANMRERAGLPLNSKAMVVFVGRSDHFQMWEESEWKKRAVKPTTIEKTIKVVGR